MAVGERGSRAVMTAAYFVVLVAAAAAAYWRLPAALDRKVMDAQMRFLRENFPRPAGNDVVLVGLDESFLDRLHPTLHHDYRKALADRRREDEYEAREG